MQLMQPNKCTGGPAASARTCPRAPLPAQTSCDRWPTLQGAAIRQQWLILSEVLPTAPAKQSSSKHAHSKVRHTVQLHAARVATTRPRAVHIH